MNSRINKGLFVYVCRAGEFIKIGVTEDPSKRMAAFKNICPVAYYIAVFYYMRRNDGLMVERFLHRYFKCYAKGKETFWADKMPYQTFWLVSSAGLLGKSAEQQTKIPDRTGGKLAESQL
jgi:hypothetical protein